MADAINVESLYDAAARCGLLTRAVVGGVVAMVEFRAPDEDVLDGLGVSRAYTIRYPRSRLSLAAGEELQVGVDRYRVREVTHLGDGTECRASLTRIG